MSKENTNQPPLETFYGKKALEEACLDNAISKIPWLKKFKRITDKSFERPDFILKNNDMVVGIEHFHIDLLYIDRKKHTGLARYTFNDIRALYNEYHPKAKQDTFDSLDANEAASEFERIFNKLIELQNDFDYSSFIKEWKRIFTNHYNKRYEYRKEKKLDKLGFLIEIRSYFKRPYICINDNTTIVMNSKGIPITRDIAKYLNKFDDGVDFFIVVVKGLLDNSVNVEFYDKNNPAKAKYDKFRFKEIPGKIKINVK